MLKSQKGQAALEYLMTYSWALVAIAIVVGVLIFMGILKAPSSGTCAGLEKLAYEDHTIDSNGNFILYLKNGTGMQITNVQATPGEAFSGACSATPATVNATKDFNVVCTNTGISAGQTYNGKITIEYMRKNARHTESATCTGTAPLSGIFLLASAPQIVEGFFAGAGSNLDLNNPDEMMLGSGGGSYASFGSYTSDIFDANSTMDWTASISWDENTPIGTDINLQTKTSDNNILWSAWSGYYTDASGQAITSPNGRFIQYRVNLSTTNPLATPKLLEVRMHGNALAQSCGNLKREGTEQCDTNAFGGATCITLGYASGALACSGACTFDTNGCVGATPNQSPFAGLGASTYSANAGTYIAFYGNTSYDPDGNIVNYAWNFGDGNIISGAPLFPADTNLLLHLNEGSGSSAADSSGNGNNGTISGATWTTQGKFGSALSFDGINDDINLGSALNYNGDITIETWVKTTQSLAPGIHAAIIERREKPSDKATYALRLMENGKLWFGGTTGGGAGWWGYSTTQTFNDGNWHHLAASYDHSAVKLYIDGQLASSNAETRVLDLTSTSTTIAYKGAGWASMAFFNGVIDEFAIYSRALDANEISARYQGGFSTMQHKYNSAGDYNVTLTVTDNNGATDANSVSVNIASGPISFCPGTKIWTTYADFNSGSDVNVDTYSNPGELILTKRGEIAPDANTKLLVHFNEGTGSTASDASGNGNNGTLTNGPTWISSGKFGSALSFDGVDDLVSIPDSNYWDLSSYFTISMWIKFQSGTIDNEHYLLGYNYGSNNRNFWGAYQGQLAPDQLHFNFATDGSGGSFGGMSVAWTPNAGQWYYLTIVRNSADLKMFIDGAQVGSTYNIGTTSMWAGSTSGIEIGSGHSARHSGEMDEVAIWNRALSANEVLTLYQKGSAYHPSGTWNAAFDSNSIASGWNVINWGEDLNYGGELPADSNTKLLFHLNETSGSTANDASGNGNNGTLFNSPIWTFSGKFGNALQFDGTDDYVKFSATGMPTGERTVEFWFYTTDTATANRQLFGYGGNSNSPVYSSFLIYFSSADKRNITVHRHYAGGDVFNYTSPYSLTNAWHHLAFTTNSGGSRLYIDGQLAISNAVTVSTYVSGKDGFVGAMPAGSGVGTYVDPNYPYWKGSIDEVAVYNAALDANKILEHYRRGAANIRLRTRSAASQPALSSAEWSNENEIDANSDINGLWHFNEGGGATTADASGNGNNGAVNGATWSSSGKFGNALNFDGVDDYVNIIKSDEFHFGASSFAVTAWVNFAGLAGNQNILAFYTITNQALQFAWSTNVLTVWGETSTVLSTSGFSPTLNRWYNVAFVRNGNAWNIYVNGISYANATDARTLNYPKDNIGIGVLPTSLQYFNGKIDELAIWNRGLSANEVLELYKRSQYYAAGPSAITSDTNRFIEVQALLETTDASYTPVLRDLNISCT